MQPNYGVYRNRDGQTVVLLAPPEAFESFRKTVLLTGKRMGKMPRSLLAQMIAEDAARGVLPVS